MNWIFENVKADSLLVMVSSIPKWKSVSVRSTMSWLNPDPKVVVKTVWPVVFSGPKSDVPPADEFTWTSPVLKGVSTTIVACAAGEASQRRATTPRVIHRIAFMRVSFRLPAPARAIGPRAGAGRMLPRLEGTVRPASRTGHRVTTPFRCQRGRGPAREIEPASL